MKLLLQILFFLTWFSSAVNATPVFTKVVLPNYEILLSKAENHEQKGEIKIDISNFARSGIPEN
jgi:hypothetical protein